MPERDFIFGQKNDEIGALSIGRVTVGYAGCGPIAVHNALAFLGTPARLDEIIGCYEKNGGLVLGGLMGTKPKTAADFLRAKGYAVDLIRRTGKCRKRLDEIVKNSRITIVQYGWAGLRRADAEAGSKRPAAFGVGGHYLAARYDEVSGRFILYNAYSNDEGERAVHSVRTHISSQCSFVFDMAYISVGQ